MPSVVRFNGPAVALAVLVAAVALGLSLAERNQDLAEESTALYRATALLGSITNAHAHVGDAVHLGVFDHGLTTTENRQVVARALGAARDELDRIEELADGLDRFPHDGHEAAIGSVRDFRSEALAMVDLLDDDRFLDADARLQDK